MERGGGGCLTAQQSLQDLPDFKDARQIKLSFYLDHNNSYKPDMGTVVV